MSSCSRLLSTGDITIHRCRLARVIVDVERGIIVVVGATGDVGCTGHILVGVVIAHCGDTRVLGKLDSRVNVKTT